jgi:hypothetical protein
LRRTTVYYAYLVGIALAIQPLECVAQQAAAEGGVAQRATSLTITPRDTVLRPGDRADFRAVAQSSAGDTVDIAVQWHASAGTIRSEGESGSLSRFETDRPGRQLIRAVADSGRLRDSITVTVVGGLGGYPNEPGGLVVLGEHAFPAGYFGDDEHFSEAANYMAPGTLWHMRDLSKALHIETDIPDAPMSPPGTMGMAYPAGMLSSGEPASFGFFFPEQRELYVSYHFMMPRNPVSGMWELEPAGVKVLGYVSYGDNDEQNEGFPLFKPGGLQPGPLAARSDYVGKAETCRDYVGEPNRITLDEWHQFEFYGKLNDLGEANGILRIWLDGALYSECNQMTYVTPDYPHGFWQVHFQPVWGGWHEGLRKKQDDYAYLDHIYVSGVSKDPTDR